MKPAMTVIACLAVFLAIRSAFSSWVQNELAPTATSKAASCLAMTGSTTSEENGLNYIFGELQNNCTRNFESVTLIFKLDGQRGTSSRSQASVTAHAKDLMRGETRRVRASIPIGKDVTYHFDTLVAY